MNTIHGSEYASMKIVYYPKKNNLHGSGQIIHSTEVISRSFHAIYVTSSMEGSQHHFHGSNSRFFEPNTFMELPWKASMEVTKCFHGSIHLISMEVKISFHGSEVVSKSVGDPTCPRARLLGLIFERRYHDNHRTPRHEKRCVGARAHHSPHHLRRNQIKHQMIETED